MIWRSGSVCCLLVISSPVWAQTAISALPGMVAYSEGAYLNGLPVPSTRGRFPQMRESDVFHTGQGRAEVLLAPDAPLRLGPQAALRLLAGPVQHPRVELLSGSAVLDVVRIPGDGALEVISGEFTATITKKGTYHFEMSPPSLRVFEGQAVVACSHRRLIVRKGELLELDEQGKARKFDMQKADVLDLWSARRSRRLADERGRLALQTSAQSEAGWWQAEVSRVGESPGRPPRRGNSPPGTARGTRRGPP